MESLSKKSSVPYGVIIAVCAFVLFIFGGVFAANVHASSKQPDSSERLITIHDNGHDRGILTKADTLREAFKKAHIRIDKNDLVEPSLDDTLVASNYEVNIYRARPVTVVDGAIQKKIMTAYRTPEQIVDQAGLDLHDEDRTQMDAPTNMVSHGAGVRLTIDRATAFTLVLYGKKTEAYTQAATVGDMLKEKGITLGEKDELSVAKDTPITAGMTVKLWRNGKQTVTEEEKIPFETEKIRDANRPVGYHEVKTPGVNGEKTVTYEIVMQNGKEVDRKEIQSVVTKKPKKQVEIIGTKVSLPPGSHEDWMASGGISAGDYGYVNYIFMHESSWNPAARNPIGYVGLGQTSEANLSAACPQWESDPICQIRFFDGYATSRYGSWSAAYDFKASHGWW